MQNSIERNQIREKFREIKGRFSLQPLIGQVAEMAFWDHSAHEAASEFYDVHKQIIYDRFLSSAKENKSYEWLVKAEQRLDQTLTMAIYLWGWIALNGRENSDGTVNRIFEALSLFTAAGYFLDDDNDQAGQDPEILGEQSKSFLKLIKTIFSEAIESPHETMKKYQAAQMNDPQNKSLLIASAAADMMGIIALNSTPRYANHFIKLLSDHWAASFTTSKDFVPDTVSEYIKLRELTSGMRPTIELVQLALGIELTDEILEKFPEMEEATHAAADFGGLLNDILSSPKEIIREQSKFNLIQVIQMREGKSTTQAFERAFEIVDDSLCRFEEAIARLIAREDKTEQERYIIHAFKVALEQIVWASVHWQLSTYRYRHELHPVGEFVQKTDSIA